MKVLIPVDGSANAQRAVDYVIKNIAAVEVFHFEEAAFFTPKSVEEKGREDRPVPHPFMDLCRLSLGNFNQ